MKKYFCLLMGVTVVLFAAGCSKPEAEAPVQSRSVSVITAQSEEKPEIMSYVGTVDAKELVSYSFKSSGKILKINVEAGQAVHKGDILANLDPQELQYQSNASQSSLQSAQAAVRKAEEALTYDEAYLAKMKTLLDSQSISPDQFNQLELKARVSAETLKQAQEQVKALQADTQYKGFLMENTQLRAETDGVVSEVLYQVGEQVSAYTSVIVVRSGEQVINVGIPQQDVARLKVGMTASVTQDAGVITGVLTNIAQMPDSETRTYQGEVTADQENLRLGAIVRVNLSAGVSSGIWVPVDSVLSEGESYVYLVDGDRALKKIVEVQEIRENSLRVTGIEPGQLVVVSGMKNLSDGILVQVAETK